MRKLLAAVSLLLLLGSSAHAQQVFHDVSAPTWLNFFGTGAESDPVVSNVSACTANLTPYSCCTGSGTGTCSAAQTIQGKHNYKTFTIDLTGTLTVGTATGNGQNYPSGSLFAYVQGACTIAGTITGITQNASTSIGGGSGGGGGFGAANGAAGSAVQLPGGPGNVTAATGGAAGTTGVAGGTGNTMSAQTQIDLLDFITAVQACGGSAGGTGNAGGAGGNGGGCVVLVCNSLNFTGTITVAGSPGTNSTTASQGAGGGGGGGVILIGAQTLTANTGTLTTSGGAAGTCTGSCVSPASAGGLGGAGWSKVLTLSQ